MKKENTYLIVVILVALVGGIIFFFSGRSVVEFNKEKEQEMVVDCLLENKVKLYLASGCEYSLEQKEMFGSHFARMDFIDCQEEKDWADICKEEKINSTPTWSFPSYLDFLKKEFVSCLECQKKSQDLLCEDYCYVESEDGNFLKISGILAINKLGELLKCENNN